MLAYWRRIADVLRERGSRGTGEGERKNFVTGIFAVGTDFLVMGFCSGWSWEVVVFVVCSLSLPLLVKLEVVESRRGLNFEEGVLGGECCPWRRKSER